MLSLPINLNSFSKSFLAGNGSIEIRSDQDGWQTLVTGNQPFNSSVDTLAEISVGVGGNTDLKFGGQGANDLKLDLDVRTSTVGAVRLVWNASDEIIKKYDVAEFFTPNHFFALLTFKTKADGSINGAASLFGGPLKATFGIGAGGAIQYERLVRFQRNDPARGVIEEIFKGARLPQSVRSVPDIPAVGEVLAFDYDGYLNLSAGLAWGYSLTGTRNIEISNLQLSLDYALRLMASASFSYRIAGGFHFETRPGSAPNWARIVVRKSASATSKFAFDFGFNASSELKGIPASPDKLIETLLEIDTSSFMNVLKQVEDVSTVEGLKAKLNDLAEEFVLGKAEDFIGAVLDDSNVSAFIQFLHRIVDTYENIDKRIIHLYEDFLDDIDGLNEMLDRLIKLPNRIGLGRFDQAADTAIWDLIRRLAGDRFYEVLLSDQEFEKFSDFVKEIKAFLTDGVSKHVREIIGDLKAEFKLEELFGVLSQIDTVTEIKALSDKKLKELVSRIVGRAIDGNSDALNEVLKPLQSFFKNLEKFNGAYTKAVEKAINQSFAFNLNYAYNRAKQGEKLLDVEIDLSQAEGRRLAEDALSGDFTAVLQHFDPTIVRLNKALFSEEITRSAELKINIFNFNKRGLVKLVQESQHSVESLATGLVHLYSIDTNQETLDEKSWRKNKEAIKTNFALKIVGDSIQPAGTAGDPETVQNLKTISAQYSATYDDSNTKIRELRHYLELARLLELVSPEEVINTLVTKFGKPSEKSVIGKVKLEYVTQYSDEAVREAFTSPLAPGFEELLRNIIREISAAPAMSKPITDGECQMRLAYRSPVVFQSYRSHGNSLNGLTITVKAPEWHRSFPSQLQLTSAVRDGVGYFYRREDSIVKRFPKLIGILQSFPNVDLDALQAEARNFVSLSDDLVVNKADNPFFALFDWFVRTRSSNPAQRKSALVLSIETSLDDGTPFSSTLYFTG